MKSLLKFNNLLHRRENRYSNVLGGSGRRLLSECLEQHRHAPASPDLSSVYINCSISIAACVRSLNVLRFLIMLQIALWTTLCFNKVGLHWLYSQSCVLLYKFLTMLLAKQYWYVATTSTLVTVRRRSLSRLKALEADYACLHRFLWRMKVEKSVTRCNSDIEAWEICSKSYWDITARAVHVVLGSNATLSITKKRFVFVDESYAYIRHGECLPKFPPLTALRLNVWILSLLSDHSDNHLIIDLQSLDHFLIASISCHFCFLNTSLSYRIARYPR